MNSPRILPLFLAACALASPALAEYKIGDTVVVVHDTKIKVGDKVVQEVSRGIGLKVQAVEGNWLWVSNQGTGWISEKDVATPTHAIEVFTDQIKKAPHDADAYICRGLAWFDKQEIDIAIADLNEAIRLDPKHPSAYSSRAICWWAKREFDKAIADCSDAIRLDPQEPMYLSNRGILWNKKGEYDKALADAEAAIRLAPDFVTPHVVRGNALTRKGRFEKALAEFDKALEINPREPAAYGLRGRVLADSGEYARAVRDFDRAVELDPKDQNACNEIARFYATCPDEHLRNGKKAVEYAQRACELSHWRWASSIGVLAAAYAEQGDFEQAVEWQEKATGMVTGKRRDEFQARLRLYRAQKPLREQPRNVSRAGRREAPESSLD